MSALISRIERGLICLTFPFLATIAFPAGVRGPVDRCQGLFLLIASRIRCMLSKGSGPLFIRLLRPASTLFGLLITFPSSAMKAPPYADIKLDSKNK
jgi:hypothetical protein